MYLRKILQSFFLVVERKTKKEVVVERKTKKEGKVERRAGDFWALYNTFEGVCDVEMSQLAHRCGVQYER